VKSVFVIVLNGILLATVVMAAYAFVVSTHYSFTVNIVASGVTAYSSCTSTGPANPVSSLSFGQMEVGGTHYVRLYLMSTVNNTVTLGWNSTIRVSSQSVTDLLSLAPDFSSQNYTNPPYAGDEYNYQMLASNCTIDTGVPSAYLGHNSPGAAYNVISTSQGFIPNVNGTVLTAGHIRPVIYIVTASSASQPGLYSWTLNVGVQ
jgi:hypothetical protein